MQDKIGINTVKEDEVNPIEQEIAAKYPTVEEFDGNLGSYLRWQYGIYASFGMSYEEFWLYDYRLVESYVKKHDLDIERETQSNWELVSYLRMMEWELALAQAPKEAGKAKDKIDFPSRPYSRTRLGALNEERNKIIGKEIRNYYEEVVRDKKGGV